MAIQKYDEDGNRIYGSYVHPSNRDMPSVADTTPTSNPLYDIPGMEYRNEQFRKTAIEIAKESAAFFANRKGAEGLALLYAEKVAKLKG